MNSCKVFTSSLENHFRLSHEKCPKTDKEKKEIKSVPYSSTVGSLMYAMVCMRPDVAHVVNVVSRYLMYAMGRDEMDSMVSL
jgi:hypothetical protein